MAQYRALHTKITQSFDFNEMPDDFTRLTWALLPLALDSEGRGIYNNSWIRSRLFPLREDVTAKQIMAAMEWYEGRGMIIRYDVEGRSYFYSPTFKSYQRGLDKEAHSVLPAPELVQSYSRPTPELLQSNSTLNGTKGNGMQTEGKAEVSLPRVFPPVTSYEYSTGWQVRVFSKVTNISGIPGGDMPKVMEAFDALRGKYKTEDALVDYLKPYFENWITRKTKDGRKYSRSNCAWLYDLALAGDPLPTDKKAPGARPDASCPKCGGLGVVTSGAKYGEPSFGKLVTCSCVKVPEEAIV